MKRFILILTLLTLVLGMGSTGFALDKVKEAEKLYQQAVKIEKTKPTEAIKLLDKAISYNPKNAEYYYKRGWLEPNYGKAMKDYERAVVLNPDKYFKKCFGTVLYDGRYELQFNSMSLKTGSWKLDAETALPAIKKYLSTYKGDRLKNARNIISKSTDDCITMLVANSSNKDANTRVMLLPDFENEVESSQEVAEEFAKTFSEDGTFTNVSEVVLSKLGNVDCAYFDYKQPTSDGENLCRTYAMAFDYYVIVVNYAAYDQQAFDAGINDFLGTLMMK